MSVVNLAGALPEIEIPGRRFAKVEMDLEITGGSFDQLPQAAQRLLLYLWQASDFGKEEVRKTAQEIAQACQRCERWVYKAIRQCLDHIEDGESVPLIIKRFAKGPREVAGRVLKLAVKFAEPKAKDEDKGKGKAKAKAKAKPAPAPQAAPAATKPSQPPEPPEPEGPPVDPKKWRETLAGLLGRGGSGPTAAFGRQKTEAEMTAEADRKKAAFADAAARRKAEAARQAALTPKPPDSS